MQIDTIEREAFLSLCQQATLMNGSVQRPKMLYTPDNEILRIFYPPKTRWSRAHWWPKAVRFQRNSQRLQQHGIPALHVTRMVYQTESACYGVFYPKIPGMDLRQLGSHAQQQALTAFPKFLAALHASGIFFRSLHLGNVLWLPTETFALIDIGDVRFSSRPLRAGVRRRNLMHLLQCPDDQATFQAYGVAAFMNAYFEQAQLPSWQRRKFSQSVSFSQQAE